MEIYEPVDIPENYVTLDVETTGLEPESYILTAAGIGRTPEDVEVHHIESDDEEPELIRWIRRKLSTYDTKNVVCWNGSFDFSFVRTRAMINRIVSPLRGYEMVDDMIWFKKFTEMDEHSLDHVARTLGIDTKAGGKGHEMPRFYHEGRYDQIVEHCKKDVELTINLHERVLEAMGKRSSGSAEDGSEEDILEISP